MQTDLHRGCQVRTIGIDISNTFEDQPGQARSHGSGSLSHTDAGLRARVSLQG
jgi:L-rhamnose isomerase